MKIEINEKGTPEFYKEVVCTTAQYARLVKNPEAKLIDSFKAIKTYIILCAVIFVLLIVMGIAWGMDLLTIVAIVMIGLALALSILQLTRLNKVVESMLNGPHDSIFTVDEEGVELEKVGSQLVRMSWNNVAFVRVFDESVCFFSKDVRGFVLALTKKYEKQVLDYIRENGINVRVIE